MTRYIRHDPYAVTPSPPRSERTPKVQPMVNAEEKAKGWPKRDSDPRPYGTDVSPDMTDVGCELLSILMDLHRLA